MSEPYDLKAIFLDKVTAHGGFVNCHAHFDKAFYITEQGLTQSMVDMEVKWRMNDAIKQRSTQTEIEQRIRTGLDSMIQQGVKTCFSFIDAYDAVGHKAMDAANVVKEEYKNTIRCITITQPLGGLVDEDARRLYTAITAKADIAGGLPSKDRPHDDENIEWLFKIAADLDKPIHVHIDQENNPAERDTEKWLNAVERHHYQKKTTIIHGISVAAQPADYQATIYRRMQQLGVNLVVCPSAALSMKQLSDRVAPLHNSIANVPAALAAGVNVAIGVDNVYDFYQPFVDGDLYTEARILMEACRFYDIDAVVNICTRNGQRLCEAL